MRVAEAVGRGLAGLGVNTVFGVVVSGRARAYPWWIAKNYHVVNDSAGKANTVWVNLPDLPILSDLRNDPFSPKKIMMLLGNLEAVREAILFKTRQGGGRGASVRCPGRRNPSQSPRSAVC